MDVDKHLDAELNSEALSPNNHSMSCQIEILDVPSSQRLEVNSITIFNICWAKRTENIFWTWLRW